MTAIATANRAPLSLPPPVMSAAAAVEVELVALVVLVTGIELRGDEVMSEDETGSFSEVVDKLDDSAEVEVVLVIPLVMAAVVLLSVHVEVVWVVNVVTVELVKVRVLGVVA